MTKLYYSLQPNMIVKIRMTIISRCDQIILLTRTQFSHLRPTMTYLGLL